MYIIIYFTIKYRISDKKFVNSKKYLFHFRVYNLSIDISTEIW